MHLLTEDVLNKLDKLWKPLAITSTAIQSFLPHGPEINNDLDGRV